MTPGDGKWPCVKLSNHPTSCSRSLTRNSPISTRHLAKRILHLKRNCSVLSADWSGWHCQIRNFLCFLSMLLLLYLFAGSNVQIQRSRMLFLSFWRISGFEMRADGCYCFCVEGGLADDGSVVIFLSELNRRMWRSNPNFG